MDKDTKLNIMKQLRQETGMGMMDLTNAFDMFLKALKHHPHTMDVGHRLKFVWEPYDMRKPKDDNDLELEDICPRTLLTDEEMKQANKITEDTMLESVKYIFSVIKKNGYGLKGVKTYFDLYIDKRNKENK